MLGLISLNKVMTLIIIRLLLPRKQLTKIMLKEKKHMFLI